MLKNWTATFELMTFLQLNQELDSWIVRLCNRDTKHKSEAFSNEDMIIFFTNAKNFLYWRHHICNGLTVITKKVLFITLTYFVYTRKQT